MSPVDPTLLDASINAIKAAYKGSGGHGADDVHLGVDQPSVRKIPFTSPSMNYATTGGVPLGRVSRFFGGFSSGKSLTSWDVIKNAMLMDLTAAYYNIEKQFEPEFTAGQGVDLEKLLIVEGTTIEEIGTKLEQLMKAVHVHILDSCSSAVSIEELGADIEQWTVALNARVWGKVLRRTMERLDINEHAIVLVDQVRDVFGGKGDAVAPPGGRFIEHTSSMTVYFKKGSWLFRDKDTGRIGYSDEIGKTANTLSEATEPDGIEIVARVEKNRVGRPFRSARMRYDFGQNHGFDDEQPGKLDLTWEYDRLSRFLGIVSSGGGYYKRTDGEKFPNGQTTFRGRATWLEFLESDDAAPLIAEVNEALTGNEEK